MSDGERTSRLLIVSNRLPVSARWRGGTVHLTRSPGGLASGLEHLQEEQTVWIGWSGEASATPDRARELERRLRERALVPVPLSSEHVAGYYDGFSNGVLWPLFHYLVDRIPIDSGNWHSYREANERFADAVAAEWDPGDRIWVHDYHLMLLPALLRERLPQARIGFFLHIPFPAADVFRILPWRRPLMEGLLGADVIGFHTRAYARHFMTAVHQLLGLSTTADHLWWHGRPVHVDSFPMGIDADHYAAIAARPDVQARAEAIRQEANGRRILVGIDRLDYTKGIPRRLLAFQRLLEREPDLRQQVRFIQVAVPSRVDVRAYRTFREELDELIGRINGVYGTIDAVPIHYLYRSIPLRDLVALYRAADVMVVTPLRDGMNLVAKEFVASRIDADGVLVLSEFAGAADELREAVLVNPYDTDGVAESLARALALEPAERQSRMRALQAIVHQGSVHNWATEILRRLGEEPAEPPAEHAPDDALRVLLEDSTVLAGPLTLLLDYDGTLVRFAPSPEEAVPDPELLNLLAALASHPELDVHIVTGRSLESANRWFWHLPVALWAEHGAAYKPRASGNWERFVVGDRRWTDRARAFLQTIAQTTPGALVEEKSTGLAWHYRLADPALAERQIARLRRELPAILDDAPVEVIEGHKVVELRPRGVSKGLVARQVARGAAAGSRIVAIGDDRTDEEMFSALPPSAVTVHVGNGATRAKYRLGNPDAVRSFLVHLLDARAAHPSAARPLAATPRRP